MQSELGGPNVFEFDTSTEGTDGVAAKVKARRMKGRKLSKKAQHTTEREELRTEHKADVFCHREQLHSPVLDVLQHDTRPPLHSSSILLL